jgi:hypothetical protein
MLTPQGLPFQRSAAFHAEGVSRRVASLRLLVHHRNLPGSLESWYKALSWYKKAAIRLTKKRMAA